MGVMGLNDDFYEEDEQVDDLLRAFDSADERGTTQRSANGEPTRRDPSRSDDRQGAQAGDEYARTGEGSARHG